MDPIFVQGITSAGVCIAGIVCMQVTRSSTGIGWMVLGLMIIWG